MGLEEITVSQDIDIVDDHDDEWVDDRSKPEVEFDDEQQQSYEQDLTNLCVLEWLNEMTSDPEETSVTIQEVDRESIKYMKTERDDPSWGAQEGQLLIPASNLDLIPGMRSPDTPVNVPNESRNSIFVKLVQCHRTEFTKCRKLLLSALYRLTAE